MASASRVLGPALLLMASTMVSACGGDSGPVRPSAPTIPATGPCQADTAYARAIVPIINGTSCDATNSSVVILKLRYDDSGSFALCSGTVVAPHAVVTAAHCVSSRPLDITIVRAGAPDIVTQSFAIHPEYRRELYPLDVAVVRTDQDIGRRSIPLLVSRAARIGESAVLAGYGRDQSGTVGTLRAGMATIDFVGETYLTTRNNDNAGATCNGDSGGPILLSHGGEWALAGVSSAGIYMGANTPLCESGISVFTSAQAGAIASFLRAQVPEAGFR